MSEAKNAPTDNETAGDRRLSIDQAVRLAMELQKKSRLDQAEGIYREILSAVPDHPDALHYLGILQYQRGRIDDALDSIARALEVAPDYVDAHNNLGNIFMEQRRLEAAEACYRRTVELAPRHVGACNNLATVLRALGRPVEAETEFRRGLAISADFFPLHYNLGNLLYQQDRAAEAVDHLFQAMVLDPEQAGSKVMLGIALMTLGRKDEAEAHYRRWLQEDPENPEARHLLAACLGDGIPERAPDDYVKRLFDRFAESFDESLGILAYRAPELVGVALQDACGRPHGDLRVLDAGCGTGLCGPLLKPYARRLEGVDLSAEMLKRAAFAGVYDHLYEAELTAFMQGRKANYDAIVCADTLCYFGSLLAVFTAAADALTPGGRFVFTVELAESTKSDGDGGFRMLPQGRYAHGEGYVRRAARQSGWPSVAVSHGVLRQEMGRPVDGLVVTLTKASTVLPISNP